MPFLQSPTLYPMPTTCGWCPMQGGTLPYLYVVPYARWSALNPPLTRHLEATVPFPQSPTLYPVPTTCGWRPMQGGILPYLWVVP